MVHCYLILSVGLSVIELKYVHAHKIFDLVFYINVTFLKMYTMGVFLPQVRNHLAPIVQQDTALSRFLFCARQLIKANVFICCL